MTKSPKQHGITALHKAYGRLPSAIRGPVWSAVNKRRPVLIQQVYGVAPQRYLPTTPSVQAVAPFETSVGAPIQVGAPTDASIALLHRKLTRIEQLLAPDSNSGPDVQLKALRAADTSDRTVHQVRSPGDLFWDARPVQNAVNGERGIARYVLEQTKQFCSRHDDQLHSFVVDHEVPIPGRLSTLLLGASSVTLPALGLNPPRDAAIWYVTSPFEQYSIDELLPNSFRSSRNKLVMTCYDLIPMLQPKLYLSNPHTRNEYHEHVRLLTEADRVLCISKSCADDVHRLLGLPIDRIEVIGAGVSNRFTPSVDTEVDRKLIAELIPQLPPSFILFPGGFDPRKNIERTIEAYGKVDERLRRQHHLVLVCKVLESEREFLMGLADKAGVGSTFHVTGVVSDQMLLALYRCAHFTWFPSTYEGFGLPVVESLACHTPVLCSNTSSLPEIIEDESSMFDPFDVRAMTNALVGGMQNRPHLTAAEYDSLVSPHRWEKVADRTAAAIDQLRPTVYGGTSIPSEPTRMRIAICTPWPPDESGVASYSKRLVEGLNHFVDVTVFAAQPAQALISSADQSVHELSAFDAVEATSGSFDVVIVAMGNSHFHVPLLEFLREHPGKCVVLAHDIQLSGLYSSLMGPVGEHARHRELEFVQSWYGHRYSSITDSRYPRSYLDNSHLGIWLFREVAALAKSVLVHSDFSASAVKMEDPTTVVQVVRFGFPDARPAKHMPDENLVVSMGVVSDIKCVALLIDAFALVVEQQPTARLELVGPGDLQQTAAWGRTTTQSLLASGRLLHRGHVNDSEYQATLARASIAVQLRATTNGESSAAIADAFCAGTPAMVTDLGPAAELPSDTCIKVTPEATAFELAETILALLQDRHRQTLLSESSLAYCADNSFVAAAQSIVQQLQLVPSMLRPSS
jgi:glycosyltransferase involved in cell wall biosynthesis